MTMQGDALDGQPGESDVTLSTLAEEMDGDEGEESLDESVDGEESDEAEVSEAEEGEDEGEDDAEDDPTIVLKHDGKEVQLKLSEVKNLAQQGFDYSQKTMAVAEERKAVAAEREQVTQVRQQAAEYANETVSRLEAFSQYMEQQLGSPPDVAMASYDVGQYIAQKEAYEARKGQLYEARAAIQTVQDEQARKRQAWIAEKAEATERALKDTLPGWNDDTLNELVGYAGKLGLSPQNVDVAMLEPGFWQLAQKAKAYDALQAEKAKLKPTAQLAKVSKPSASNPSNRAAIKRAEAEKRFAANPTSINALADLVG